VNIVQVVPPLFEGRKRVLYLVSRRNLVGLVEFVENVVVELSTSIDVVQKRLSSVFWRVESILVVVVHLCLSMVDKFVQFLLDERGKVQVIVLNPLLLVVTDGDILSLHSVYYTFHMYKCVEAVGWLSQSV
jgi:hypothetical protein